MTTTRSATRRRRGTLRIAPGLALPLETVTRSLAILAIKGAGKTYTGSVIAEEVLAAGVQLVVLDPLGAWWGLRSAAAGTGPGYPVVIFGGEHGDIPLDATTGSVLADLVVEHRISCILDLSAFRSKADERRFAADFGEQLFRAKGPEARRTALLFVVDEADEFMPQRVMGESARMLGAYEQIAKRGRIRALGLLCISQRAAAVHKDVLTQCSTLIAQRTVGKQDRTALERWIEVHGTPEQRAEMMSSVASLQTGEAWVWDPEWDLFQRVRIRRRHTYDSSATPKPGQHRLEPSGRAAVDLDAIRRALAGARSQAATANHYADAEPESLGLRRRIRELEEQLQERAPARTVVERVAVPVLTAEQIQELQTAAAYILNATSSLSAMGDGLRRQLARVATATSTAPLGPATENGRRHSASQAQAETGPSSLRAGEWRMLQVLARHHPMRMTRVQLGQLSRFTPRGGTFNTYLGTLRRYGLVQFDNGELQITRLASHSWAGMCQRR